MRWDVVLRDTRDGSVHERAWDDPSSEPDDDSVEYYWTEGNFGCDCNRSLFLYGGDREMACNSDDNVIELVSLAKSTAASGGAE
ncbi:MAG: hypothetical protein ACKVW3_01705 [Phycisphaerales bacterium]